MKSYTFHITLVDVAFLGALFIGITFILLLWFTPKVNRAANRFLAAALAVAVLWVARLLALDVYLADFVPPRFSLALGPLLYFYVHKIANPDERFKPKDSSHFIPLLLELATQLVSQRLNAVLQLAAFISVAVYLYRSRLLIENFYQQVKFTGIDRYRHELKWLRDLLTAFGLLWLLWVPFAAVDYFYYDNKLSADAYYPLYLLLILMMVWIGARAFLRFDIGAAADTPPVLKPLLPADVRQKAAWVKNTVKQHRYYEDPELSLATLAEKLDLHTHELSRIINTVFKKSFNDFINEYRVQAAIRKMQDAAYDHITLLGIAYESGFNSQSSFNRVFKQISGKSPVEYKNSLKKESPTYNLGSTAAHAALSLSSETTPRWSPIKLNRNYMFKNYFKIARRNLSRNKGYTAINVTGLAVGIAVCMLIFIIIQHHNSFDNYHAKKDRTYRVLTDYHAETGAAYSGKDIPFPLPLGLQTAFPQVEQVAPIYASQNDVVLTLDNNGNTDKLFKEQRGLFYASPSFFKIFDFPLLAGSYESLADPNNVLLTKEIAEKYFGDWRAAMGKTIKLEAGGYIFSHGTEVVKVTGILATIPVNTDFQFKLVASYQSFYNDYVARSPEWQATTDFGCYVLLPPNVNADGFNQQLAVYSQKVRAVDNKDSQSIQPLSTVHYDTQVGNYSNKTISHDLINVLWLIAGFILLIACVNFINLSTAQAVNRAKEVGVRKVLGSNNAQLQAQFIVETFLIVAGAVIIAGLVAWLALPYINGLLELSLSFNIVSNPAIILFLLAVTVVVTALAGFYPSVVLSRFNPVHALKSKVSANATGGLSLRRGLVVFQFIIAQVLIIGTLIIVKQMSYFMDQPLGFDKEAIVNVPFRLDSVRISRLDYLRNRLMAVNGVQGVTYSTNTPVEANNDNWTSLRYDHAQKDAGFKAITKFADHGYVQTYKLKIIAGRNIKALGLTKEFLVNETMLKSLGIKKPEDIINKEISIWNGVINCPVVGVVKDFNDRSFRHGVAPLIIAPNTTMYNQAGIKLSTTNLTATLQSVKEIWQQTFPDFVYEYKFLDEKIAGFYKQESQLAQLYKLFAGIAIFLSCLGLYGLASFMAVQRVKEVGIRKVLGAGTGNIVYLFSKEFIVLIGVAFAIAAPIAWYYMHQWLQGYVYRINISLWLFAAGGFAALLIAMITVSSRAIKAALANPVKSLRSE